ncbi:hypothetical protein [Enterococcus larvae]|uniref:hypothetical protein n=1 Tax=Enterococcus larvae TaxID=2794352 RepID=UPI003F332FA6
MMFLEHGVRFVAVNNDVDSDKGENEFAPFKNIFNEWYARDTSKKIKYSIKAKGKQGKKLSSNPPYGYKKDSKQPENWIIDEETVQLAQKLRKNKRRPTKYDTIPLLSGLLVCPKYGKNLSFLRAVSISKNQEKYVCSTYRARTTAYISWDSRSQTD